MASIPDKALFDTYAKAECKLDRVRLLRELSKAAKNIKDYEEFKEYLDAQIDVACAVTAEPNSAE